MSLLLARLSSAVPRRDQAKGFTLVEILVAVLIFGILASIATFTFSSAMSTAEREKASTALMNAGIAIDKEVVDNNGLYPTYLPNEIRQNEEMGDRITYTYAADRGSWCLAITTDTQGTLYFSSATRKVQADNCTQALASDNTNTDAQWTYQWTPPTPTISSLTVTWPSTGGVIAPAARVQTTLALGQCTAENQAVRGNTSAVHVKVKATNSSRSGAIQETAWIALSTFGYNLPAGWAPTDNVQLQVQASCVVNGVRYDHGSYGASVARTIPRPVITAPYVAPGSILMDFADDTQSPSDLAYDDNPGTRLKKMAWTPTTTCPATWDVSYNAYIMRTSDNSIHWGQTSIRGATEVVDKQTTLPNAHAYSARVIMGCTHPAGVGSNSTTLGYQATGITPVKRPKMATITSTVANPPEAPGYALIKWTPVTCDWPTTVQYRVTTSGPQGMFTSAWQTTTEATIPISASGATIAVIGSKCVAHVNNGGGESGINTGPPVSVNG